MTAEFTSYPRTTIDGDRVMENNWFRVEVKDSSFQFDPKRQYKVTIEKL